MFLLVGFREVLPKRQQFHGLFRSLRVIMGKTQLFPDDKLTKVITDSFCGVMEIDIAAWSQLLLRPDRAL